MAAFVIGGVSFQIRNQGEEISALKDDFKAFQLDMKQLQIEQAKDNDFRKSGERFSKSDGNQLELRSRDYTDRKISLALDSISNHLAELKQGLSRVNDKIDELNRL